MVGLLGRAEPPARRGPAAVAAVVDPHVRFTRFPIERRVPRRRRRVLRVFPAINAQGVKANVLFFDRKPGAPEPWTKTVWVYDLRTNRHFTLKTRRLVRADLDEFVECYRPGDRHTRKATWSEETPDGRWRPYTYEQILARDKVSLDLFWLRDESLEDSDNLPDPHIIAQEIADDLRAALAQIEDVLGDLEQRVRVRDVG